MRPSDRQRPRRSSARCGALLALLRPLSSTPAAPAPAKKPAGGKRGGHRNGKLEQVHGETHFEVSRFEASK